MVAASSWTGTTGVIDCPAETFDEEMKEVRAFVPRDTDPVLREPVLSALLSWAKQNKDKKRVNALLKRLAKEFLGS